DHDLRLHTGGGTADHYPAARDDRAHRLIQRRRSDVLEHDVNAIASLLAHSLAELGRVESSLSADLDGVPAFDLGAARREHTRAEVPRDPHRCHGDSGARANDQNLLAGLQTASRREHPPRGEEGEGKCCGLGPRPRLRLAKDVARVDVEQLSGGPVRVLADDAEPRASDVLPGPAPLALPAADDRVDHDLVARLPGRVARGVDYARTVGSDDSGWRHALRAVREEQVEVVDRGGANYDRHGSRDRLGPRHLT